MHHTATWSFAMARNSKIDIDRLLGTTTRRRGMDLTGRGAVRKFSEDKGKILSEEGLAAETVYIHKMERGKMEKLKKKIEMEKAHKDKVGSHKARPSEMANTNSA